MTLHCLVFLRAKLRYDPEMKISEITVWELYSLMMFTGLMTFIAPIILWMLIRDGWRRWPLIVRAVLVSALTVIYALPSLYALTALEKDSNASRPKFLDSGSIPKD